MNTHGHKSWWHNGNSIGPNTDIPTFSAIVFTSLLFFTIYIVGKIIIALIKGIFSLLALPFKKKCCKKKKGKKYTFNGYKAKSGRVYR